MNDKNEHPNENYDDKLIVGHEYDGIQELDNFLPRWWLGIMYGSMIFAAGYWVYYHMGPGPSIQANYKAEIAQVEAIQAAQSAKTGSIGEAELVAYSKEDAKLKVGKAVWEKNCVSCHMAGGQGLVGPNLTDDYWIHGKGNLADILNVVKVGVLDKGMPPWGSVLSPEELYSVVGFVKSLRGTNPPNPKAPQGELVQM